MNEFDIRIIASCIALFLIPPLQYLFVLTKGCFRPIHIASPAKQGISAFNTFFENPLLVCCNRVSQAHLEYIPVFESKGSCGRSGNLPGTLGNAFEHPVFGIETETCTATVVCVGRTGLRSQSLDEFLITVRLVKRYEFDTTLFNEFTIAIANRLLTRRYSFITNLDTAPKCGISFSRTRRAVKNCVERLGRRNFRRVRITFLAGFRCMVLKIIGPQANRSFRKLSGTPFQSFNSSSISCINSTSRTAHLFSGIVVISSPSHLLFDLTLIRSFPTRMYPATELAVSSLRFLQPNRTALFMSMWYQSRPVLWMAWASLQNNFLSFGSQRHEISLNCFLESKCLRISSSIT